MGEEKRTGDGKVGRWKDGKEKMKEIKYLGYVFQENGRQEGHIRGRVRRAMGIVGQVWDIGKRKFKEDIGKRFWLFDTLV